MCECEAMRPCSADSTASLQLEAVQRQDTLPSRPARLGRQTTAGELETLVSPVLARVLAEIVEDGHDPADGDSDSAACGGAQLLAAIQEAAKARVPTRDSFATGWSL